MIRKIGRLFVIKNRFEASAIIYALALGGAERGKHYLDTFPGFGGKMLFLAAMVAVFMAGSKILDALSYERVRAADAITAAGAADRNPI
ncbi:hypothetical protein [Novosphingobium sp.]|uniref:hypothetical protein n=1 Tax=Novosphingobium sp. TaxID=1874826 RepID=UPI003340B24D